MNIAVLCSGGLGFELLRYIADKNDVVAVMTDRMSIPIAEFCSKQNIPIFVGNPRNGFGYSFIKNYQIDVLVSVNYLYLIEKDVFSYPSLLSFNIHGSLLPKYRGRTPHVWAIINSERVTGITAHKIDDGCDTGDIISQIRIPIDDNDTGNDVLLKFYDVYKHIVFDVFQKLESGTITFSPQNHFHATFFGKRVPEDGRIDWNWQKERIRNWVRAQAHPYPGAFSFHKREKITIDEVCFTEHGFNSVMPNGMIIDTNPLLIKTPNGVVLISKYRENIELQKQEILT